MAVTRSTLEALNVELSGSGAAYTTASWTAPGTGNPILHVTVLWAPSSSTPPDLASVPTGWTQQYNVVWNTSYRLIVLSNDGTATSVTVDPDAAYKSINATYAFDSDGGSLDQTTDFVSGTANTGTGTSATTGSVTTSGASGLIAVWANANATDTFDGTPDSSFTDVGSIAQSAGPGADGAVQVAERAPTTGGTYSSTDGWTTSAAYIANTFGYDEGSSGLAITPAAVTVTVTEGTLTITTTVDVTPGAVTVNATPGTVTVTTNTPVTPAAVTVNATPGTVTITTGAVDITPAAVTITATPGTVTVETAATQAITPGAVTVTATPGGLTVTSNVDVTPTGPTVTATPGTLTITTAAYITPAAVTVSVTPASVVVVGPPVTIYAKELGYLVRHVDTTRLSIRVHQRGRYIGMGDWEIVSGYFVFNGDHAGWDDVMSACSAAWQANKSAATATLTAALNQALQDGGYRDIVGADLV